MKHIIDSLKPAIVSLIVNGVLLSLQASPNLSAITAECYPDADSVVVSSLCEIAYRPDGTSVERDETVTKVLTEKGRRAERVQSLSFSRRYGESKFVAVSVVGTNGVERTIDFQKTLKESTDNGSVAANIYDPLDRRLVCAVPSLAVGETLRVVTERRLTAPRVKDHWADIELFEGTDPILRAEVRITAPAARPLRKIAVRHPLGNLSYRTEPAADGATLHVWCATNSPQAFPEPDMPPLYTQLQNLYVSTAESWEEISRWYWELCAPHIAKTNAAMVAKVRELVDAAREGTRRTVPRCASASDAREAAPRCASASDAREAAPRCASASDARLRAIFKFVSQEVRYMGLTLEDTSPGYSPHDASLTFDNRYGVCRDKAALLVSLLRIAGFEAYPVLIHAGAKMDDDVPTPFFNHAIVAVHTPLPSTSTSPTSPPPPAFSPYILMDPTDESSRDLMPSYLGDCSYLIAHPEGEPLRRSPVTPPEKNRLTVNVDGTLARDGSAFADVSIDFGGMNDTLFRHALVRKTPDERRKLFERLLGRAYTGAELLKFDVSPADLRETDSDLSVTLATRLPDLVLRGESRDELAVPFLSPVLGLANWLFEGRTSLEHRRFPLELPSTASIEERVSLKLGEEMGEALALPPEAPIEGKYAYARTFAVTNGTLAATRSLTVSALTFATNEYALLREDLKRVEAQERVRPLFAPNFLAEADVRNLLVKTEVDCRGPDCWTVTNTTVREILTYDGKKRNSEMKLGFHPDWKQVEVVSAVVSNRDGTVSRLTPKELNVLDCGWAASAPRYPAGKTLVVSLPRVEIGSVIKTVVATTVTNAPAPFYGFYAFDTTVPTERLEVRVNGWHREVVHPKRLVAEPFMPDAALARDVEIVTSNSWARAAALLRRAAAVDAKSVRVPVDAVAHRVPVDAKSVRVTNEIETSSSDAEGLRVSGDATARRVGKGVDPSSSDAEGIPRLRDGAASRRTYVGEAARLPPRLREIRDWMAKNVRLAGPSLYDLPLARQLTPPERVLAERYATRLDYIRTLCALLKGEGFDADIVFAADDAGDDPRLVKLDQVEKPKIRAYAHALCRVRVGQALAAREGTRRTGEGQAAREGTRRTGEGQAAREGTRRTGEGQAAREGTRRTGEGQAAREGTRKTESRCAPASGAPALFLGTENEYTPLGASAFELAHFFDPVTEAFGVVTVPAELSTRLKDTMRVTLRENGAADFDFSHELWGAAVGPFRKRYAEMLPELRDRHHQQLLGNVADAASATGDLVTDVTGYPAKRTFSCYVPDFAVVRGGAMTVTLAPFMDGVIAMNGTVRRNPIGLPGGSDVETEVEVVFPEGYAKAEHLPEPFRVHNPLDASEIWSELSVAREVRENRLVVRLRSRAHFHPECTVPRDYFPLFKDWAHSGLARPNRTLVVAKE